MKTYSTVSEDVERIIKAIREEHYSPDLDGVTVSALFVYDMDGTESVLVSGGYPAQAEVSITPVKQRALGIADAVIIIDRSNWLSLNQMQRNALIDHELYHLERVDEGDTAAPKLDAIDRPKLKIRRHDHQIGVFKTILERHGKQSAEHRMIKAIMDDAGQLYWDFEGKPQASRAPDLRLVAAGAAR